MLLLCWSFAGHAQTINVPLGQAASFGLLSGGSITADTLDGVRVRGAVGANGTITGNVVADGGVYRPSGPTATAALADLAAAKAYCSGLSGQSLSGTLDGVLLAPGVYNISGNAALGAFSRLMLIGSAADRYVFNVTGNLLVAMRAYVERGAVRSDHIYWNVQGTVTVEMGAIFHGLALAASSIQLQGPQLGRYALLTTGNAVTITGLSGLVGTNYLVAASQMTFGGSSGICPPATDANLVNNGGFENFLTCPQDFDNMVPGASVVCDWTALDNMTSSDYFNRCFDSNNQPFPLIDVPTNCRGDEEGRRLSSNTFSSGYAGILAFADYSSPDGLYHEYIRTSIPTLQAGRRYYAEFYWNQGEISTHSVWDLGMYFSNQGEVGTQFPGTVYKRNVNGVPTTVTPQVRTNQGNELNNFSGWQRVSGLVVPQVGELLDRVIIGNFESDADILPSGVAVPSPTWQYCGRATNVIDRAYYFIEDATIWELPTVTPTATICSNATQGVPIGILGTLTVPDNLTLSYTWIRNGNTYPAGAGQPNINVTSPGTYVLTLTINGGPTQGGQNVTYSINVTNATPSVAISPNPATLPCNGNGITLTATSGLATYEWTLNGQPVSSVSGSPHLCQATQAGTYTVRVTAASDPTCFGTATVSVLPPAAPTITINPNPAFLCPGQSVILTASGATSYVWSTGATAASITVTTVSGDPLGDLYTVTGSNGQNCSGTASVRVRSFYDFPDGLEVPVNGYRELSGNLRIRGTVRIKSGGTLKILEDSRIEFADTRETPTTVGPTGIVVERGGTLDVQSSTLQVVSIDPAFPNANLCGDHRMWDGIIVQGNPQQRQLLNQVPPSQGYVKLTSSTILDARYGVLAANAAYAPVMMLPPSPPNTPNPRARQITTSATGGGGIVEAVGTTFRDCYTGVYLAPYNQETVGGRQEVINLSRFTECNFIGTAFLRDQVVYSNGTRRYGMAFGADLNAVTGIRFWRCNFTGFRAPRHSERGIGIRGNNATFFVNPTTYSTTLNTVIYTQEGAVQGVGQGTGTFSGLQMGIYAVADNGRAPVVVKGQIFRNNWRGVVLNGANGSYVRGNVFSVGTSNDPGETAPTDQTGLYVQSSTGVYEANTFYQNEGSFNHGLTVSQMSRNGQGGAVEPFRNRFVADREPLPGTTAPVSAPVKLFSGLYAQYDNSETTFRCNQFEGNISRGDVYVLGTQQPSPTNPSQLVKYGIRPVQGYCSNPSTTLNNRFSRWSTSVPSIYLHTNSTNVTYYYPQDVVMTPRRTSVPVLQIAQVPACPYTSDALGCERSDDLFPRPALRSQLAITTDSYQRALLLNRLLVSYLTDTLVVQGVDSAIALLQAESDPARQTWLNQLLKSTGQYTAASRAAAPRRHKRGKVSYAARNTANADYYQRVLDLLAPLGTDSACAVAVRTDEALRTELVQMAEDSMTWGSQAARTALNRYAGTHYSEWIADEPAAEAARGKGLTPEEGASASVEAAPDAVLRLVPNPSVGPLEVQYALPAGTRQAELLVYDSWGRVVLRQPLAADQAAQAVLLRQREGLYQCALVADGRVLAKERLLLERR